MDIKTIKRKIEALSPRERVISVLALIAVVVIVPHTLLYSPSSMKVKAKQQMLQNLKKEIEIINSTLVLQRAPQKEVPVELIVLPETEDLAGMLAAISREASMAKVDFISIAPESVDYKNNFVEMKVKIELRVRYRQLYDFLDNLRLRHKMFLIQDLKFETNDALYPSGIALIKAVTYLKKK